MVFGKWRGQPSGTIRVSGVGGEGDYENVFDVAEAESSDDNRALRYLWARERVRRLSDYNDENEEVRLAVTELGLNYELLTQYTSFVAVHEVVRNPDGSAKNVTQPLPLPQGVSDHAVAVPEPELPLLALAVLLLLGMTRVRRAWS